MEFTELETADIVTIIIVWLISCYLISLLAKKKGRDAIGFFILSILISPLLTLIVLLIAGDSDEKRQEKVIEQEIIKTKISASSNSEFKTNTKSNKYDDLEKLGRLFKDGIISKDEFEIEKKKIFSEGISRNENHEILKQEEISLSEIQTFSKINKEIDKTRSNILGTFNQVLVDLIEEECSDKTTTLNFLSKYERHYKEDLINKLKDISLHYDKIRKYLAPFIDHRIVESNYPHDRIIDN